MVRWMDRKVNSRSGIVFPLFSYYRWKDKKMADYMLTAENLDKMREHNDAKDWLI